MCSGWSRSPARRGPRAGGSISALRRLRDTERPIAFKPWIYEIAKNACIDEFRRTCRCKEVPLDSDEDSSAPELRSWGPMPDSAVESKQQLSDRRGPNPGGLLPPLNQQSSP